MIRVLRDDRCKISALFYCIISASILLLGSVAILAPWEISTLLSDQTSIEVASAYVYDTDHIELAKRIPRQLRSIRVTIVSEKAAKSISVRYRSLESLSKYFSHTTSVIFPCLDEKFTMGTKLANRVLYQEVSFKDFAETMKSEWFWLVNAFPSNGGVGDLLVSKKDSGLTSVLKGSAMLMWGVRRQVKFLGKHSEITTTSSFVNDGKVKSLLRHKIQEADDDHDHDEKVSEVEEEEKEEKKVELGLELEEKDNEDNSDGDHDEDKGSDDDEDQQNHKRKRYSFRNDNKVKKKKNDNYTKSKSKHLQMVLKNPINRWSTERYKSAEKNLLEVMKAKEAVFGKPILRLALRAEARKRIGGTGLLDHLLKHMAGKVAPGGKERFRRRHNADGAMEYWLESADLVSIREEAGVQDPYWTPPPGWKPGDCPNQDPICVKEFKFLKGEISDIRREREELVLMKNTQIDISQEFVDSDSAVNISVPAALISQLEKYKKQMLGMSNLVKGMEEEIGRLTSEVGEKTKVSCSELSVEAAKDENEMIIKQQKEEKWKQVLELPVLVAPAEPQPLTLAVEKAEKIKRLRSGFRLCKPQGTSHWPNSSNNIVSPHQQQVVVQFEDHFMLPTPSSVSSSYNEHHNPAPLPLAERCAVTMTVSTNAPTHPYIMSATANNYNSLATTLVNLNDTPVSPAGGGGVLAEVEILGNIRHWNIGRWLGCCSNIECTILVYEYMANGSLDDTLVANLFTRNKIALGLALGICYVDCHQVIVHLDLKPNNTILLDSEMEARVSVFGVAKLIDCDESMSGSYGCIAPDQTSIEVGSDYKIDDTQLPTRTTHQLRPIRVIIEEIGRLTSEVGEKTKGSSSELSVEAAKDENEMMIKQQKEEKRKQVLELPLVAAAEPLPPAVKVGEEKAEKIKRLRSGFRLCKPQGNFLWPSSSTSTKNSIHSNPHKLQHVMVQFEDHFIVHIPPSVSSSSYDPVKPLAERREVIITVSANPDICPAYIMSTGENTCATITNSNDSGTATAHIYLNDTDLVLTAAGGAWRSWLYVVSVW